MYITVPAQVHNLRTLLTRPPLDRLAWTDRPTQSNSLQPLAGNLGHRRPTGYRPPLHPETRPPRDTHGRRLHPSTPTHLVPLHAARTRRGTPPPQRRARSSVPCARAPLLRVVPPAHAHAPRLATAEGRARPRVVRQRPAYVRALVPPRRRIRPPPRGGWLPRSTTPTRTARHSPARAAELISEADVSIGTSALRHGDASAGGWQWLTTATKTFGRAEPSVRPSVTLGCSSKLGLDHQ